MAHLDHKEAFQEFKAGVLKGIESHFPVEGNVQALHLKKLEVDDRSLHVDDIKSQKEAKLEGKTWAAPVYAHLELTNKKTGEVTKKKMKVAEIPFTTRRYGYIVNGQEYQVDNQWQLKPGAYTKRRQTGELETRFNVGKSGSFDVTLDPEKKQFTLERNKSKIPVYPVMKAMGVDDDTLKQAWGPELFEANKKARGADKALEKFFKSDKRRPAKSKEEAEKYVVDKLMNAELDPDTTEITLGKPFRNVDGEALTLAMSKMVKVQRNEIPEDDRDSLVFKNLRSVADYANERLTSRDTKTSIRNKMRRNIDSAKDVRDIIKSATFNEPIRKTFTDDTISNPAKQINPVEMVAAAMRTTVMGPGGIKSAHSVLPETKLINPSHLGFLDPLHTPESNKTGVTMHLPMAVRKEGNKPTIPLYNVKTGKMERVDPKKAMQSNIVLADQVDWDDKGRPTPIGKKVKMSSTDNEIEEGTFGKADYVMKHPSHIFSVTSNLIPFMGNNSGNRASYATHHIEQAVSLLNREAPLVQVGTGSKQEGLKTFEEFLGRNTGHTAPVSGTVQKVTKDAIVIKGKDGRKREVQLYNNFPLNDATAMLDSTPVPGLKVGQEVKQGQAVADTNYTQNGRLALGTNLNVAYIPYKGYNFEDGVVISESAAKKLSSQHLHKPSMKIDSSIKTDVKSFKYAHLESYTKDQFSKLNDHGMIQVGQKVMPGDPLVLASKETVIKDSSGIGRVRRSAKGQRTDASLRWDSDHPGEVTGVHRNKKTGEVTVHVRTIEQMQVGDKISGRYGNKGIVTQILPDTEMPRIKGAKPDDPSAHVEVALNPSGVPGRMNIGQVLETAAAKVAKKTGQPYVVENFGKVDDMLSKVKADLKKHNLSDTEELIDPKTGQPLGKALMGPQQMLKLTHQVSKKLAARSGMNIPGAPIETYDHHLMPKGGGKTGGQRIGNLGLYTMLAHGATANLREMQTWKSEGEDPAAEGKRWKSQHQDVWNRIQNGEPLPAPTPTFSYQKFTDMLRATGVNVEKEGSRVRLTPMTDAQVEALAKESGGGKLKNSVIVQAKLDKEGRPVPFKGGLFDEKITGGHDGKKWSYMELPEPMPNPMFEKAIPRVLGIKTTEYTGLIESQKAYNPSTGKFVPVDSEGSITGGAAIAAMLEKVDVKKELEKAKKQLNAMDVPEKVTVDTDLTKVDQAVKKVKYLSTLDELGMSAKEAYTLTKLPVLPPAMRPVAVLPNKDGKTNIKVDDLNELYKRFGATASTLGKDTEFLPDEFKAEARKELYDGLKAITGMGITYDKAGKNKGIMHQIMGPYPKAGYFQKTLLNRRQDLSMRSTIVPEPDMALDQVGVPEDKAATLFRPFVIKELVNQGAASTALDAAKMLGDKEEYKKNKKFIRKALDKVMEERPILMKRDPALHKHSIQAFNARRVPGKAIQIHPLVTNGYNADFDGDAMSMFVPISKDAVAEAKKMYPTNNLFNAATGKVTNVPTLESALGLYKLSRMNGEAKKSFGRPADALRAAQDGKLKIDEPVKIKGVGTTTAGRVLLSTAVPKELQNEVLTGKDFKLDKKGLPDFYQRLAKEHTGSFGDAANKLKDLGYDAAYGTIRMPHPNHKGELSVRAAEAGSFQFLPVGTHTLSLDDFEPDRATRDPIVAAATKETEKVDSTRGLSKQEKDRKKVDIWKKATVTMTKKHLRKIEHNEDNLALMLKAGVKPKLNQYQQMKLAPVLVEDSFGRTVPTPITKSYAEGLDLAGYWTQMHGARKGSVQKVQEVQEPGAFSKQLINSTMDMQITAEDCGTKRGVALDISDSKGKTNKWVVDRELAAPLKVRGLDLKPGAILDARTVAKIKAKDPKAKIIVRSTLKCEHGDGICQKCAGISATGQYYDKGTNVGVIAAQSLGERAVQLTLKSFHSGGVVGGGGKTLGQFKRVKQLTELPSKIPDEMVLATQSGTVQKVEKDPLGHNIYIGGQKRFVPFDRSGSSLVDAHPDIAKSKDAKPWKGIRPGMKVRAGDPLSDPNRTFMNPHRLYEATGQIEKVQNEMTNELHDVFGAEGVQRQHVETVVKAMSNLTRVRDPGSADGLLKGQFAAQSKLSALNKELVKQGKKPVIHTPVMKGVNMLPTTVQEDWMAKMNFQRLNKSVADAAATGGYSDLHGTHPIPGLVYGAEFGRSKNPWDPDERLRKLPKYRY